MRILPPKAKITADVCSGLTRPKLNDYTVTREELMERANDIFKWIGSGDLQVAVDRCFPLEQAVEGHNPLQRVRARARARSPIFFLFVTRSL